jgi:uncharacterized protein YegL
MNYTETRIIQLLIDASGSMENIQEDVIDAGNAHILAAREASLRSPETRYTLGVSLIGNGLRRVYAGLPPAEAELLKASDLRPDGNTALFDAMDAVLNELEGEWSRCRSNGSTMVEVYIITDGQDSASRYARIADLRHRIEMLTATGEWTFHFDGADLDTIELSALLAFRREISLPAHDRQLRSALIDFLTPFVTPEKLSRVDKGLPQVESKGKNDHDDH